MRIKDNFLDKEEFDKLSSHIMGESFPWYYSDIITNKNDTNDKLYFVHHIYNSKQPGITSDWCNLFNKFLKKLNYKSLIRIKANLYIGTKKKVIHEAHKDFPYKHKGCILYMNVTYKTHTITDKKYPGIVHADGTTRLQIVDSDPHRKLLEAWKKKTKCPMILNTSLNIKGEPIVNDEYDIKKFTLNTAVEVL